MPVESATYIDGLNASNPLGTGEPKSLGDDHMRLIKSTIKASFPAIAGAVSATHTELSYVTGVTSALQTQLDAKAATSYVDAADAVLDAAIDAAVAAAANASNLASGTVADARLSANVALLNAANVFTNGGNRFAADDTGIYIRNSANNADISYWRSIVGNQVLFGTITGIPLNFFTTAANRFSIAADGGLNFYSGAVTTANDTADEVGYKGVPMADLTGSATLSAGYTGACAVYRGAGGHTITVSDSNHPAGSVVSVLNTSSVSVSIAVSGSTLKLVGAGTTGTRTLAAHGLATLVKSASDGWYIGGGGVS